MEIIANGGHNRLADTVALEPAVLRIIRIAPGGAMELVPLSAKAAVSREPEQALRLWLELRRELAAAGVDVDAPTALDGDWRPWVQGRLGL